MNLDIFLVNHHFMSYSGKSTRIKSSFYFSIVLGNTPPVPFCPVFSKLY
jgi:hypothetical protein